MAGDWLKFDKATPEKQEVFAIASSLNLDPDTVVGKLMRVWSWFDTHTENGNAAGVTPALLDRCAGVTGFVAEMQKVGWIVVKTDGVSLPNFTRHCGKTAKTRALGASRSAGFRGSNGASVTSSLPREEKRREEKKEKATPNGDLLAEISPQVAKDFRALRTKLRAPITATAVAGIRREADKAGLNLEAAITVCCERGWRGFKADWLNGGLPGQQPVAPVRKRVLL